MVVKRSNEDFGFRYHDDPIYSERASDQGPRLITSKVVAFLALLLTGAALLQTTLAANISLSSSSAVEFGQGIQLTTACSGSTALTVTPNSSFENVAGAGSFYFSSVTVSNIPSSCNGVDFQISAYGETSTAPLALFNSSSSNAVVYNNAGTFESGAGATGMTVSSGSGTFTATFTTPVATSGSVFRITLQSAQHALTVYNIGDVGPGGGKIFYIDAAGFNCGASHTSNGSPTGGKCNYLEVAPSGWNTGSDPDMFWAISANRYTDIPGIPNEISPYNNALGVGLGLKNSIEIVTDNGAYNASSNIYAAGAARAYAGGSKNDWYLPATAELNLLCQWARGVAPSVTTVCTGGTINSATYGATSAGFGEISYWSSSEYSAAYAWFQIFDGSGQSGADRNYPNYYVRPIRAF
jgi:hypothetical protein